MTNKKVNLHSEQTLNNLIVQFQEQQMNLPSKKVEETLNTFIEKIQEQESKINELQGQIQQQKERLNEVAVFLMKPYRACPNDILFPSNNLETANSLSLIKSRKWRIG